MEKHKFYNKIIKELNLDIFLGEISNKHKQEKEEIKSRIETIIYSLIFEPEKIHQHTNLTLNFLRILWKKYDCEKVTDFFKQFARIEPTLLSLVGIRDHFLHIFHVFLFGLRIISNIIAKIGKKSQEILKVKDENENTCVFLHAYNYKERIFYIWTLASTFHDIGYPLQDLPKIERGFQKFTDFCKFSITPLNFKLDYTDVIELDPNFRLISGLYGGKLAFMESDPDIYEKIEHPHFYKVLISAFRERDHGVLSAIILLRLIEYIFLFPSEFGSKYQLSPEDFNKYIKNNYDNDIIRVALIISLHNLKGKKIPKIPKIRFSEFPLAFILILADEIQEFLRKKTDLGEEKIILKNMPDVKVNEEKNGLSILIKYSLDDNEISEIKKITKSDELKEALELFWQNSTESLTKRLSSELEYQVIFKVYKDIKKVYEWSLP